MYLHPLILIPILIIRHVAADQPASIYIYDEQDCKGLSTTGVGNIPPPEELGQKASCLGQGGPIDGPAIGGQSFKIVTDPKLMNASPFKSVQVVTFSDNDCKDPQNGTEATCAYYGDGSYPPCGPKQQYPAPEPEVCVNVPFKTFKAAYFSS